MKYSFIQHVVLWRFVNNHVLLYMSELLFYIWEFQLYFLILISSFEQNNRQLQNIFCNLITKPRHMAGPHICFVSINQIHFERLNRYQFWGYLKMCHMFWNIFWRWWIKKHFEQWKCNGNESPLKWKFWRGWCFNEYVF